jgi:site-specific recombinase XerD
VSLPVSFENLLEPSLPLRSGRPLPSLAIGGNGALRAAEQSLIAANNDLEAVACWLREYLYSPKTLESYWTEAERLLLWAGELRGKSLSALSLDDFVAYENFLADPQPASLWCGARTRRGTSQWRPFVGPLSASSRHQSLRVLNSLLSYLVNARYLVGNPLALRRRRIIPKMAVVTVERFLDANLWNTVRQYVEQWPLTRKREINLYERARWIFSLLYLMDLRRDEVVSHTHGAFSRVYRPVGEQWWLTVTGKGKKTRRIPCPVDVIVALKRYRQHLGLSVLPDAGDETPLVCRIASLRPITGNMLYRIVKLVMDGAANIIETTNPAGAQHLRMASTHWLRHTGITHKGDAGISLKLRGLSAGHSRLDTTARYDHAADDQWYAEIQKINLNW